MVGRNKKDTFAYVKDRIWKRINSWRGRALSKVGKEVMIKSVLQSILSYVMSVYLIPEMTIKKIERMINSFWWGGGRANNRGIKWLAWDRMTYPKEYGGLGFRNLHLFNMAMVAKQGWNFIMKPHSLVAKVYKARYFPNSSLFEAHLGNNPSYAWRSIWKSRHVLMNGCRWRIGDVTKIKVMNEPWLRKEDGLWVQSPQQQGAFDMFVNQLMLPNEKVWDSNKIHTLFPLHIAKSILDVPLFDQFEEDKLIWLYDTHGNYNVKSGYNLLLNPIICAVTPCENEELKWLWKIQAPPKAKHLLWRICKECLPTRTRLRERFVNCPLECPMCGNETESDWHFLFDCMDSKRAWQTAGLEAIISSQVQQHMTVKEALLKLCRGTDVQNAGKLAMVVWALWNNRNNWVWNHTKESGQQLGVKTTCLWSEWRVVQDSNNISRTRLQVQQHIAWQKPLHGHYKCNVDAGFHDAEGKTSAGWCVRDYMGRFIMAGTVWMPEKCSIIEGEAMAMLEAMKELERQGFTNVIFETDSKNVADAIQSMHNGVSDFSVIVTKIRCILSLNSDFVVKSIKRQANMVAHTLARAAISWSSRCLFELAPPCIESLLYNETISIF
ncbi:hypothetical protein TSUD_409890 [Trifolium subterraneum]|uniref:RNase H type-1 domain-containing protein n=1 Tax=Trifolium subterraneum TaxID=3900 RepID=A0A2Z6PJB8_TRISU|nr:hypothetical protein TSUD_409890 [Trifolium subterraneum]